MLPMLLLGQNWPQFRGPGASGVAEKANPPVAWSVDKATNIRWKSKVPGVAVSSPIVWGDRIFITTAVSGDPKAGLRTGLYGDVEPLNDTTPHVWKLLSLDRSTGAVRWVRDAHTGTPKTKRHPKSSQASPTPATDGKHVVAFFGSEGLFVFDMNGKLLWKKDLGVLNAGWFFDPDYEWGVASSPIIYKDTVIVQCDIQKHSFVAAFRLRDGQQVWRTAREEIPSWGSPTIYEKAGHAELITHATKFIRGYDPRTGAELWRLGPNSEITTPTPIVGHDLIFVTNGYRGIQPIYAIRPGAKGDITLRDKQESSQHIAWSKTRGGVYTPTPLVYGEHLYLCSNNGVLSVFVARTGERLYQQRIGDQGGAYSASPVAADGKIYLTGEDGDIAVVKAGPKYELLAMNSVGEVCMATPAISGDLLILRTLGQVIAIGEPKK